MAVHIYGVVPAATRLPGLLPGRREAPVRLVVRGDLAAVVSEIDADARLRRDDLLAHARVLESLVEDWTVLPMRFGVIVDTDEEVAHNVLEAGEDRLTALLISFDGLVQLTVKAYHDQDQALKYLLRESPELRELRDQAIASHHYQLTLGEAIARALDELASDDAAMVYDELAGLADHIVSSEVNAKNQILDAALLVQRGARTKADEGVTRLRQTLPDRVRLRYIGPLPPYSFVDGQLAGEPVWA